MAFTILSEFCKYHFENSFKIKPKCESIYTYGRIKFVAQLSATSSIRINFDWFSCWVSWKFPPLFRRSFTDFPWFSTMFLCVDGMCRMEPNRSWGNFGEGVRGSQSFSAPGCSPPTDSWILSSVKLVQPISVVIAASHAPSLARLRNHKGYEKSWKIVSASVGFFGRGNQNKLNRCFKYP